METDDLGENAVVANRLVQMKLVCHVDVLLIVCFPCGRLHIAIENTA
jgi:hypothetical protein